ncbi:MAG: hypothetical protein WC788_04985 [Candidatus Paceibacterota bacterium]|jgi:hypothetical protein
MAKNKTKKEPMFVMFAKTVLGLSAVAGFIVVSSVALYVFTRSFGTDNMSSDVAEIRGIEISSDARSILSADTKQAIFTIDDSNKYMKDSGYAYDSETFQDTNAKYAGDCFLSANLSSSGDRIVFSSGCLAGDLPQAWIGIYKLESKGPSDTFCKNNDKSSNFGLISSVRACISQPSFYFLIGGSGRNFVWSQDDKTITYEADLGLSGMTETRMIDSATGEILDIRPAKNDVLDWQTYRNEEYGFEAKYPKDWSKKDSPDNNAGILLLNSDREIVIGGAAPDDFFSSDGREMNPKYTNDWIGVQIDVYSKPINFNWSSWLKSNFSVVEKYESYQYEGLQGIRVTELNGLFYGEPNIFLEGEKIYNIRLYNDYSYNIARDSKRDDLALDYFDKILSTFKFTEPE